jgi:serine/threonine protein kinase
MSGKLPETCEAAPDVKTVGPYLLLEPLGRGGMGTVYRAVHQDSGQGVALKTVQVQREGLSSGLRREIHALARLEHPGIVRILDEGLHEGSPWYAMELLEGTTLRAWGRRAESEADTASSGWWTQSLGPSEGQGAGLDGARGERGEPGNGPRGGAPAASPDLPDPAGAAGRRLAEVLSVVRSLCGPLAYLHGEGIVHRDLKPENVLVRADGRPAIVDFGLAMQFAGSIGREALDLDGGLSGTVSYMAPEQARGQIVDARADLYALGCVLYELLAGRPPFVGQTPWQVVDQHLEAEAKPPSEVSD